MIFSLLQTLVSFCLNHLVMRISLSYSLQAFQPPHLVYLMAPPFRVLPAPLALLGWQLGPISPHTCLTLPGHTSLLLEDVWGCLSPKLQGKPGHKGNWPATQTYPRTVCKQTWQGAWPPRRSRGEIPVSKCEMRREKDGGNSRAFSMIWSRIQWVFRSLQFPLKTLAHSDKITWEHKPVIAQFCSRLFERLRGCFLIDTAPSGIPLCCCAAARCRAPAGIRSRAGLQGTGVLWITSAGTHRGLPQRGTKWGDAGWRSRQANGVTSGAREM